MEIYLGQKAKHRDLYNGKDIFEIVGIRKEEVELEGSLSDNRFWISKSGLIVQNIWGHWIDKQNDIDFTKNAGPRD